jgi:N-acetylglucosamine-6-phosphate deacetylase
VVPPHASADKIAITNVRLVLPDGIELGTMLIEGGRIVALRAGAASIPPDDYAMVDGSGRYCAPGLIDVHVHGGGGFDLMTDDPEQVRGYARWIAGRGVTSFLVSTSGRDHAEIVRRLRALAQVVDRGDSGGSSSRATHEQGTSNADSRGLKDRALDDDGDEDASNAGPRGLKDRALRDDGDADAANLDSRGLNDGAPGGDGAEALTAPAARVAGFHLEGPYINPVRKGAFPPPWLRAPSASEYGELLAASGGALRQMTLAPELDGGDALVDAVVASGVVAAIGHTDATYDEAMASIGRGVTHATHCYNAMRPFGHRDPGVLGAVMTSDGVTAELIGDGAHVDFAAARVLIRAKGARNVVLITDGMPLAGTPDGAGEWEGQRIRVEGGKAVRVSDGTIIGGVITLDQCVRNAVAHMDVPLHDAIAMASVNPARAMRLDDRGILAAGRLADFVLLDDDLRVRETWIGGSRAFVRG